MEYIEAKFIDTFKDLFGKLFGVIDKFARAGGEVSKPEKGENNEDIYTLKNKDERTIRISHKVMKDGSVNVRIEDVNGTVKVEKKGLSEDDAMKFIEDTLENKFGVEWAEDNTRTEEKQATSDDQTSTSEHANDGQVTSSKRINACLHKVVSATGYDVVLSKVYGNYSPSEMAADLDELLNCDNFISQLPEQPTCYEVVTTDDEMDVSECQMPKMCNPIPQLLTICIGTYNNLKHIHWNFKGTHFDDVHNLTDNEAYTVMSMIDTLAELSVEICGCVPHIVELTPDEDLDIPTSCDESALMYVKRDLLKLADALEFYECNFDKDVQDMFSGWVRQLRKDADFFITGRLSQKGLVPNC